MNPRSFRLSVLLALLLVLPISLAAGISATGKAGAVASPVALYLPLVLNPVEIPVSSPVLLASNQPHPNSLVVDTQNVYWTNCGTDLASPTDGAVMVYSKSRRVFHPLVSGLSCPNLLQADSTSLFWINRQWFPGYGQFTIFRLSKAGGGPVELASYTNTNGSLALDDTFVYWRDYSGMVMRVPKTGGIPEPTAVPSLVFDGPDAYWLNPGGDLVRSLKDGSSAVTLVKDSDLNEMGGREYSEVSIQGIFPRTSAIYFSVFVDNIPGMISCTDQSTIVMRIPKGGGEYENIAGATGRAGVFVLEPFAFVSGDCPYYGSTQVNLESLRDTSWSEHASAMADDQTYVYWADYDSGRIKRMKK